MDSIKGIPADDILVSKVIHNSYNVHENFLTLNSDLMMELNKI
jgi:rod shape-determining protein MreC